MAPQFEKTVGVPVKYEMLYVGEWKQNLLLADRYASGRVFLAGDAVHLMIPTGGLGMNSGVGDAIDLAWKLEGTLRGWGGPQLLASYESERRQIGERNVAASRYASQGRRKWRSLWRNLDELVRGGQGRAAEVERDDRRRARLPLPGLAAHRQRARRAAKIRCANTSRPPGRARACRTSGSTAIRRSRTASVAATRCCG